MALRINTNIDSLKGQRYFGENQISLSRTLERLSSGLRINRAADDAARLAISEKMRTQIRGFAQAIANAQDGVNLISTAEGAIDTSNKILQRMRELAIQSSNDTLVQDDREKIQTEIEQLRLELTRVADTTEFNTRKLLDGSIAATSYGAEAELTVEQNVRVGDTEATIPSIVNFIIGTSVLGTAATLDVAFQVKFLAYGGAGNPVSVAVELRSSLDGLLTVIQLIGGGAVGPTQIALTVGQSNGSGFIIGTLQVNTANVSLADIGKAALVQLTARRDAVTTDNALTFHIGPNEGQFVKVGVDDITAKALRVENVSVIGTNAEDSRVKSQNLIGVIDQAIDHINTIRARLGAFQNRVEYSISNLTISKENITASESRIRDTDMAEETAALTRSQILVQAGTAVLSQANFAPQTALSLLQG